MTKSGCSAVLVDHATKDLVASYGAVLVDGHHRIVVWRALVEALVGVDGR